MDARPWLEPLLRRAGQIKIPRVVRKATRVTGASTKGSFASALLATMLVAAGALLAAAALASSGLLFEQGVRASRAASKEWFYHPMYAFIIALANNVDNLGARIAYSIQGTRVSLLINLWISIITFGISYAAARSGTEVADSFGSRIASVIAMGLLVALGSWMILQSRKSASHGEKPPEEETASLWTVLSNPHRADLDDSKHIDFKEGTVLGVALSINNIGGGLSAGIIGISPFLVGFLSAVVSFVALWAGNYVAEFFVRRRIADRAAIVGGALLIAIGIKQVF